MTIREQAEASIGGCDYVLRRLGELGWRDSSAGAAIHTLRNRQQAILADLDAADVFYPTGGSIVGKHYGDPEAVHRLIPDPSSSRKGTA